MQIISINTGHPTTDETLANSVRNTQIGQGKGALIVRKSQTDNRGNPPEPRHLLEKIIVEMALPADGKPIPADEIPWKNEPAVILTGGEVDILEAFEAIVPGFNQMFGAPVPLGGA